VTLIFYQNYNPLNNQLLSTLAALIPILILISALMIFKLRVHWAALLALASALILAVFMFKMPVSHTLASSLYGVAYGFLPIGWIVLNVIFFFRLLNRKGVFTEIQRALTTITNDRRLQLLLVAFCFGALLEGAAGFGTPVAITAALLIGLGFPPLQASGLSLLANTAPVAFGGLGTPIVALQGVTGLDLLALSGTVGKQLFLFGILVPVWLVWVYAGWKGMRAVLPAILLAGSTFALSQLLMASLHGPWLVDVIAGLISMLVLILFLRKWKPRFDPQFQPGPVKTSPSRGGNNHRIKKWMTYFPWVVLVLLVLVWGLPQIKTFLDLLTPQIKVPFLDQLVFRVPPVVPAVQAESAIFRLGWLSATGTAILISALISGMVFKFTPQEIFSEFIGTLRQVRYSLVTISAMMAVGFVTRYSGMDATLGLAVAKTGWLYPFFGTLLGWLGVALTGSDTSSNVLFGSLQKISAQQLGIDPVIMASANSAGGVMGKMIDAQSIVVASTATRWFGHEGEILRYVFLHSLVLAVLMGLTVLAQVRLF